MQGLRIVLRQLASVCCQAAMPAQVLSNCQATLLPPCWGGIGPLA